MEHRVEITISEHGRAADNGDRLLGGFHDLSPEVDAVVDQNTETGHLTATFFVDEEDAQEAVEKGAHAFAAALVQANLELTRVIDVRASLVSADEEDVRELEPAGA